MESIRRRVERNGACPYRLELLDHQRVSKEAFRLRTDGDLYGGYPKVLSYATRCGARCRRRYALKRIKVIEERVNKLARRQYQVC